MAPAISFSIEPKNGLEADLPTYRTTGRSDSRVV